MEIRELEWMWNPATRLWLEVGITLVGEEGKFRLYGDIPVKDLGEFLKTVSATPKVSIKKIWAGPTDALVLIDIEGNEYEFQTSMETAHDLLMVCYRQEN